MPKVLLALVFACLLGAPGCTSQRVTTSEETATHQLLMSTAVGAAVDQLSAVGLRDKIVFVDSTYLASEVKPFVLGELRARLLISGVRLIDDPKRVDAKQLVILEVRSGGVGIDSSEYFLGIPHIDVINTPEFAVIKNLRQRGYASVAFVAYFADSGELLTSSGPFVGRSLREDYWLFGSGPRTVGNIPTTEKR